MDAIRINVTVHQDDHPQLFDYLQSMPTSNYRRHGRILALLNAGLGALSSAGTPDPAPSLSLTPIMQNASPPPPSINNLWPPNKLMWMMICSRSLVIENNLRKVAFRGLELQLLFDKR